MLATYSGTASIEAFAEADVIAKVGGEVRQLLVEEGDEVKSGQVLAELDPALFKAAVDQSRANRANAEASLKLAVASVPSAGRIGPENSSISPPDMPGAGNGFGALEERG